MTQQQYVAQVAAKYGLSPQTLWGIYGAETSFGHNVTTSSAGAEGPMQFLPSTWASYGGGGNINSFTDAVPAAARLLKALGANSSPTSSATITALNNYNGNGGGATRTSYAQTVLSLGQHIGAGAARIVGAGSSSAGSPSAAPSNYGGFGGWLLRAGLTLALVAAGAVLAYAGVKGAVGNTSPSPSPAAGGPRR